MAVTEKVSDEIRQLILDKAVGRFGQYGIGKTTMVEIARDCDMSAGNLYRYFESKREIGVEVAKRFIAHMESVIREVVRRPDLTPAERLEAFVIEKLQLVHRQVKEQPHILELVYYIFDERWDLVEQHRAAQTSLMSEILAEGNRLGDFEVKDVAQTAQTIYALTTQFRVPHFMNRYTYEAMEKEARGAVSLIIQGLGKR